MLPEFEEVHILTSGKSVQTMKVIMEDDEYMYTLPTHINLIPIKKTNAYKIKEEAMYDNMIRNGGNIRNCKGSPYYEYYRKRAKKDNPEILV